MLGAKEPEVTGLTIPGLNGCLILDVTLGSLSPCSVDIQ